MLLDSNKKQSKQEKKNKDWAVFQISFYHVKSIHDKIIPFDAALLVQKGAIREGYAEESIISNYSLILNKLPVK